MAAKTIEAQAMVGDVPCAVCMHVLYDALCIPVWDVLLPPVSLPAKINRPNALPTPITRQRAHTTTAGEGAHGAPAG